MLVKGATVQTYHNDYVQYRIGYIKVDRTVMLHEYHFDDLKPNIKTRVTNCSDISDYIYIYISSAKALLEQQPKIENVRTAANYIP